MGPLLIGAYPVTGLINPLWGSLFGFPLYAAAAGHPVYGPHPWTELAAFFVWPLMMIALMVWMSGRLVEGQGAWRKPILILWIASAFIVLPLDKAWLWLPGWPLYGAFE